MKKERVVFGVVRFMKMSQRVLIVCCASQIPFTDRYWSWQVIVSFPLITGHLPSINQHPILTMSSETSSPHSVEIHVTPPRKSSTPVSADTRSDIVRESVEIRGKGDGDASSLLQQNLVYGSEMDALLRAPAFKHQGMSSCPELSRRALNSSKLTPPSSNSPRRRSPAFHSLPVTPRTFRSRLGRRFRRVRPWRSPVGSSRSISPNPPPEPIDEFKLQTGKERRRRARDSGEERGSRSSDEPVPMISAPTAELEGTRQLAVAGVILATSDLDRLSVMARRSEEKRDSRAEQTQSV